MGEVACEQNTQELQYSAYNSWQSKVVPEIVEILEEADNDNSKDVISRSRDGVSNANQEVFVAVGKDDLEVLKWALSHVVSPGTRVNLIHIFPPVSFIPTPVGRLWINQMSPEQIKVYANEEHNRRRNMLNKYIRLCIDSKVNVDTIIIESNETTKAIMDLIPVLNMTSLIMGTKNPPSSRRMIKGLSKGMLVRRSAPDFCKVTLVYIGKKLIDDKKMTFSMSSSLISSNDKRSKVAHQHDYESNTMDCRCFPVKFY